ncbi:ATP-dependent translocase ABCB1-like [Convolutriloba macropyga]|uniref:ATP-dependent translocase ABCB1-like n=1 Tax=Convolutriloba macropyga TaxID=536237 RepID=UPI003F523DA1
MLLIVGIVASILTGVALPVLIILFGDLMESMLIPLQGAPEYTAGTNSTTQVVQIEDFMEDTLSIFETEISEICINMSIVGAAVFVSSYFQIAMVTLAGENVLFRLRQTTFKAVLRQDIAWFDHQKTGTLVTRLADDTEKIRQGISDKIAICVQHSATFVSGFIIAFSYGPKMAAVMCSLLPLLALGGAGFAKASGDSSSDEQKEYGEAGAVAEYTLSSIRTVVAFGGEPREMNNYNKKLRKARTLELRKATLTGGFLGWAFGIMFAGYGLAFWYGPKQIVNGTMGVSEVMTVFFSVLLGALSVGQAVPIFGLITSVAASYSFIHSIINRTPPIDTDSEDGKKMEGEGTVRGQISFRNVSFSYPSRPNVQVLKNFTLEVQPSRTVALVGASGSGKSTIVNLIQRFYNVSSGEILLDNIPLSNLNLNWLREQIGIVSQEPILFGCSIRENIEFGRDHVTTDDIKRAIEQANAKEFIDKLPQGVETMVGERGSQLSGGQKQRIAIARALVRNPKILLLDEATSALDSNSERIVQDALDKARAGRTTIVVAHRLSTIKEADKIVVMMGGEIREVGTHEQLLSLNAIYSDLITAQSIKTKGDDENSKTKNDTSNEEENSSAGGGQGESTAVKFSSKQDNVNIEAAINPAGELPGFLSILKLNKPEVIFIMIACVFASIGQATMPMFAIFFAEIMKVFVLSIDKMQKEANFWSMMFVMLGLIIGISLLVESWALGESGSRLTERLRSKSFKSMLRQDMSYFDDEKNYVGVLTTRLAKETSLVQGATGIRVKAALEAVVGLSIGLGIALVFGWQLALLLLAAFPLIGIAGGMQAKFAQGFSVKESEDAEQGGKVVTESISNIRTVQSLGLEKRLYNKFYHTLTVVHSTNMKFAHVYGLAQSFSQCMFFFIYAGAFRFAAWLIVRQQIDSTDAFRVVFALVFAATGIGQASAALQDFAKAQIATKALLDLFSLEPKIDNLSQDGHMVWNGTSSQNSTEAIRSKAHIAFKKVHFRYPSRPKVKVLKGLDLEIEKGKTVALVGPSGCGKSTLMQLLQRFYDPEEGEILLNGYDIKQLNVRELRRCISIVSQEPSLFNASIQDNIRYGSLTESGDFDPSVTLDDVKKAAASANLHEFVIGLPQGYDTNVGEKGTQMSGGQKQRIAIARALIRNPEILLLDEATSALDSESEKVVQVALDAARKGRTCLVIAHRLTTIQNADEIVVIDQGDIVQRGTHEQLYSEKSGLYFKFCQAQSLAANNAAATK